MAAEYAVAARAAVVWAEVPIVIDGTRWTPRSIRTKPRVLVRPADLSRRRPTGSLSYTWFPFTVRTSLGESVAEANLGLLAVVNGPRRLPVLSGHVTDFRNHVAVLLSANGMWLGTRGYHYESEFGVQLNVDFAKLPSRVFGPSRAADDARRWSACRSCLPESHHEIH